MRLFLSVCVLVGASACSSPTAPTVSRDVDAAGEASHLSWGVLSTSSSCAGIAAPSPRPEISAARIQQQPDGSMIAAWPYVQNGRDVTLYARFVRENGAWAMCEWDTADV